MRSEFDIFRCPFFEDCTASEADYFFNDSPTATFFASECKMPFLVFKTTGDPICRLTFDPDAPDARLDRYAETLRENVRMYRKPIREKIRGIFGGRK